jgi:hypothetical protein
MVSVKEPQGAHYGGVVSAPAVKEILRQSLLYLEVPPAGHVRRVAMSEEE